MILRTRKSALLPCGRLCRRLARVASVDDRMRSLLTLAKRVCSSPQREHGVPLTIVASMMTGLIIAMVFFFNGEPPIGAATFKGRSVEAATAPSQVYSHGSANVSEVALTFDDGPSPYTLQVLAVLQQYNVKATFFLWGEHVQQYPGYAKQELAAGHAIGNHTWTHPHLTTLSDAAITTELTNAQNAIQQATGYSPTLFRPPYGEYNSNVLASAGQLGLSATIIWSYAPLDWETPPPDVIASRVLSNTSNGSIILFHDGGGDRSNTVAALPTIIQGLQARGLRLVTVPQILADTNK